MKPTLVVRLGSAGRGGQPTFAGTTVDDEVAPEPAIGGTQDRDETARFDR